jgi:dienelactone hydrolase
LQRPSLVIATAILLASLAIPGASCAEPYVEIASRGQKISALLLRPDAQTDTAVILLAGGDGRLDIAADGTTTRLRGNSLVRTRELFRRAGLLTLVPDVAPDLKQGASVRHSYRAFKTHADDVGAMVAFLRQQGSKRVVLAGTSRGSLSVSNAVSRLARDPRRPDAQVLTSGLWRLGPAARFSIWKFAGQGNAASLNLPTLLVLHRDDTCTATLPADVPAFRRWLEGGGARVAVRELSGGRPAESDECQGRSAHGFFGLDEEMTRAITDWIRQLS